VLIALLVALDFVLEPILQPAYAHLVLMVVGIAGVLAFSTAIFGRLTELYRRDAEQAARLRALNVAGMALAAELETASVLQRVVDQARAVADAKYAALGVFDENGASDPSRRAAACSACCSTSRRRFACVGSATTRSPLAFPKTTRR